MKIVLPPPAIPEDAGFTPETDIFGRASIGAGLKNLLCVSECPLVVAVDGEWGSGKSTFLQMWAGDLRRSGFPVIYFDAFANDYVGDAFVGLAGEVIGLVNAHKRAGAKARQQFTDKTLAVGKALLRSSLKVGVRGVTMGLVNSADFEDLADAISEEASEVADQFVGELITRHLEQRDQIETFKSALSDLPAVLSLPAEGEEAKPLVFIVDELDRCRPDFALELLERIKHFFSVSNIHFVMGVHMRQLENSVSAAYGAGIDSTLYLQKFFHLTVFLNGETGRHRTERTIPKYISHLKKNWDFPPGDAEMVSECLEIIQRISEVRALSLRAIERIFTYLSLSVAFTPANFLRPPPLIAGLCILKVTDSMLFAAAKRGALRYSDVQEPLAFQTSGDDDSGYVNWTKEWWQFCLDPNAPQDVIENIRKGLIRYSVRDRIELVQFFANEVVDRLQPRQ